MKVRLGYVSISKVLNITPSHTITYKNYMKLSKLERYKKLDEIINKNLDAFLNILKFNLKNEIYFYRATSTLIPLATHPLVDYNWKNKYNLKFKKIGEFINKNKMRVDFHAEEFCVLNSIKEDVVNSSINILKNYQTMLQKLGICGKIVLHVGSTYPNKEEALNRFINNFNKLDDSLKKLIILENDDKSFSVVDTLYLCKKLHIPMVLDYHHHLCLHDDINIKKYINEIFDTWNNDLLLPKVHFSTPKSNLEYRAHNEFINASDFIKFIDEISFINRDFDVMLEAKGKDEALFKLVDELKIKYKFIKKSIFLTQKKGNR